MFDLVQKDKFSEIQTSIGVQNCSKIVFWIDVSYIIITFIEI